MPSSFASIAEAPLTLFLVGETIALSVDSFTSEGVAAEHKRCGSADPFIVPVAKLLPKATHPRETVLVADRDTPYRVLWEVFYTIQHTLPGRVQLLTTTRAN